MEQQSIRDVPQLTVRLFVVATAALLLLAPAASAAKSRSSSAFKYHGKTISPQRAAAQGLICAEGLPGTRVARCFADRREANRKLAPLLGRSRTGAARVRAKASMIPCPASGPLSLYRDVDYGGWGLDLYARQIWYDMGAAYDNQASSYAMGNHGGHIASETFDNGLGYHYPGPTSWGSCGPHMSAYKYKDTTWNNKASSRYRK
jgi:hypothetical protein